MERQEQELSNTWRLGELLVTVMAYKERVWRIDWT